jgi:hypothetical protein
VLETISRANMSYDSLAHVQRVGVLFVLWPVSFTTICYRKTSAIWVVKVPWSWWKPSICLHARLRRKPRLGIVLQESTKETW